MDKTPFTLRGDHIALSSLLKIQQIAVTGGHAGIMVEQGEVKVNGDVELRKRRKIVKGDQVEVSGQLIIIV